mmetsp:Transcript_18261/g.25731  ORF Transcript_18261/g.25731 Transcript_18261/m.25731 type:complete len:140 (+) Transcript_18261:148-567(+)
MIVPILPDEGVTTSSSTTDAKEWAMIELNGELIMPKDLPNAENDENQTSTSVLGDDRVELGAIRFTEEGKPMMTVGSHELKGSIVNLKEPFAVMKKKRKRSSKSDNGDDENNSSLVEYRVMGIVKKKFLFDQYPKSIMR